MQVDSDIIWPGFGEALFANLEIDGDQITGIHRKPADLTQPILRMVLPGFVNAHCHLDLTTAPVGEKLDQPFAEWLLSVRTLRKNQGAAGLQAAAREGVRRSLDAGTTTLVDYDPRGHSLDALAESPLRRRILREVIGFNNNYNERDEEFRDYLAGSSSNLEQRGLAPHAPYSVQRDLFGKLLELCSQENSPWSMHVAEQDYERRFLLDGQGPYAEFLRKQGQTPVQFGIPQQDWVLHLEQRGALAQQPLLVHGNYLREEEIQILALRKAPLVFCPRSHRWFSHAAYPLPELLLAGVPVALGTDSLYSNGSLSMLDEVRELKKQFPEIDYSLIFEMITSQAHTILQNRFGSGRLEAGAFADLVLLECPRPAVSEQATLDQCLAAACHPHSRIVGVMIAGEWVGS